jgi:hypothetical protein
MTYLRALGLAIAAALAVEAGIFYLLVGLGTGEDLIVDIEMIWLCVAAFLGVAFADHFSRADEENGMQSESRPPADR